MYALVATKSNNLNGNIKLKGAKNSILPILAACVLTKEDVLITNCPVLSDIIDMLKIISSVGGKVNFYNGNVEVCCKNINPSQIDKSLMKKIRSSIFILGPLLSRCGEAEISLPGGCEIGARPIDLHLDGLRSLGVKISQSVCGENSVVRCKGKPVGGVVRLKYPSVGATENLMMAGALSSGTTAIYGAALEPEIVDLATFLNNIGARVYGAGTSLIIVEGKTSLHGARFRPITDRIIAGTYIAAVAVAKGDVFIEGAVGDHLDSVLHKFRSAGVIIEESASGLRVKMSRQLKAVKQTVTLPYPGFPTDLQPLFVAAMSVANGESVVTETLFENRFRYVYQLGQMGADIILDGENTAIIRGKELSASSVFAQDLRGGAALTVAALAAEGESIIYGVEHIDRGYENIENDLTSIGANVMRVFA
ncbi:MAG: UDP-N-acetylglucosamine 1-carboxyvinyltransferase [Clostridia bacterium]|nr:UDP-N-acetylglucosamine 1-carboxyvinyltransferase [Clostridia bacterium]